MLVPHSPIWLLATAKEGYIAALETEPSLGVIVTVSFMKQIQLNS
jgi:hypothetical protein